MQYERSRGSQSWMRTGGRRCIEQYSPVGGSGVEEGYTCGCCVRHARFGDGCNLVSPGTLALSCVGDAEGIIYPLIYISGLEPECLANPKKGVSVVRQSGASKGWFFVFWSEWYEMG